MRFCTFLCMLLAIGSGYFLYTKKHETELLNNQIKQTIMEINKTKENTARLKAMWVLENQPKRLKKLSEQETPYLVNTSSEQYVSVANLRNRLPPVNRAIIKNESKQVKKFINDLKEVQ